MNYFVSLMTFQGISDRKQYWKFLGVTMLMMFSIGVIMVNYEISIEGINWLLFTSTINIVLLSAMLIRRLRDVGWPLWLSILAFVPYAGIPSIIIFGLKRSIEPIYVEEEVVEEPWSPI